MSSVLSEYPETLPAPMVGVVVPTERRKISSLHGVQNFRTVQRDRHGTRTYAFTYTREQAAIFREWWAEWEQLGGGWFAANWPLPWSRGPNVFRFKGPPSWSMIPGGNKGQGYWRVSGTVEIRGRGMLPTVEVMYLTSTLYPVFFEDSLDLPIYLSASARNSLYQIDPDSIELAITAQFGTRNLQKEYAFSESINISVAADITARIPQSSVVIPTEGLSLGISAAISAKTVIITHIVPPESLSLDIGATFNAV